MKQSFKILFVLLSVSTASYAGFRMAAGTDPNESELKSVHSNKDVQVLKEVANPARKTASDDKLPSQVKNSPQQKQVQKKDSSVVKTEVAKKSETPASAKTNLWQKLKNIFSPPVKSVALPEQVAVQVPVLSIPVRKSVPIVHDFSLQLKKMNHEEVLKFAESARKMKVPEREYEVIVRAQSVKEQYAAALLPYPHKKIRTNVEIAREYPKPNIDSPTLQSVANFVQRVEALSLGLDGEYPRAVAALYELSQRGDNTMPLQARDALFAGILAQRADWNTSARFLFEEATELRIEQQRKYLEILLSQLDQFNDTNLVDSLVRKVKAKYLTNLPEGNNANYFLAKTAKDAGEIPIKDKTLGEKIKFLQVMKIVKAQPEKAAEELRAFLSIAIDKGLRERASLSLARVLSRNKQFDDAAEVYKGVSRDHQNRMELLLEVAYADFNQKKYQESLGKSIGLQTPYFQYGFVPDAHFLEIVNRRALCDFGGAEQGAQRMKERYQPELNALLDLETRNPEQEEFYRELISYKALNSPMRFQRALLKNALVIDQQKTINNGEKEIHLLETWLSVPHRAEVPESWNSYVAAIKSNWTDYSLQLKKNIAFVARAEAKYQARRLEQLFEQVDLFSLDNGASATKNFHMQSALNFPAQEKPNLQTSRHKLYWPFEQEVWEDELDDLKVKTLSKCVPTESSKQASIEKDLKEPVN